MSWMTVGFMLRLSKLFESPQRRLSLRVKVKPNMMLVVPSTWQFYVVIIAVTCISDGVLKRN